MEFVDEVAADADSCEEEGDDANTEGQHFDLLLLSKLVVTAIENINV
jgi:hypothetical protein